MGKGGRNIMRKKRGINKDNGNFVFLTSRWKIDFWVGIAIIMICG